MNRIIIFAFALLCVGCQSKRVAAEIQSFQPSFASGIHVLVYKTTKDYRNNVPVILSADKSEIVSYPHPNDLFLNGKLAVPDILKNDYLLDNRGINSNVAFLKYTYQEYSKLQVVPPLNLLYQNIIDKDPLTELWDCGLKTAFSDMEQQLNTLIQQGSYKSKFKKIK
jgi:hypothetical protein